MKVVGLDGRSYNWDWRNKIPMADDTRPRSTYHLRARGLLKKLFPCETILEEVYLPGSNNLSVDFYIPFYKTCVEVQGEQHYRYIQFFQGSHSEFLSAKLRDTQKQNWINLNGLKFIELPYTEDNDEWTERIREVVG
jgi:hypothetical protein